MKRLAIYFAPRDGAFADAAAAWLGRDARNGKALVQPDVPGMAELTSDPRRYGFHATIKPPFRLREGTKAAELSQDLRDLAAGLTPLRMEGLELGLLEGFLALTPIGDAGELRGLAALVVQALDRYRAPLSPQDIARRRPELLSPRQRELLTAFGYPHVMEEFQFHLTLSCKLDAAEISRLHDAARSHFAGLLPRPFMIEDLCLFGEDAEGQFHLLHRYPLSA